jgi:hypothetical protein
MNAKRNFLLASIMIIVGLFLCGITFGYPTIYPTGTTIYDPEKAYSSYILVPEGYVNMNHPERKDREKLDSSADRFEWAYKAKRSTEMRLIDMNGNTVHKWNVVPNYDARARLTKDGHLVLIDEEINAEILEYDWDGNIVFRFKPPKGYLPHNDIQVLPNGNIMFLCDEHVPEEYLKGVKDVDTPWWGTIKRKGVKMLGEAIFEVTPKGEIVWEWHAHQHLDINKFSPLTPRHDWPHANAIFSVPENKWYDAGDKRFKPGNIIFNPRNLDTIYIVDKDTKQVVWEYTHHYQGGMAHCHESQMIEKGLQGAGNIIFFDNGLFPKHRDHSGQTIILEINPVTKDIVWKYETLGYSNIKFFSKTKGSMNRLPNGNTFISEDNTGRLFQVNAEGDIVWEYVNRTDTSRAAPYAYDYCPQLKAMPRPKELKVTPPNNLEWHLKPDALRQP